MPAGCARGGLPGPAHPVVALGVALEVVRGQGERASGFDAAFG